MIAARHRLYESIHTGCGQPGLIARCSKTLRAVIEKKLKEPMDFIPKPHVGQSSEERSESVQHSIPWKYMTDNKLSGIQWTTAGGLCWG